MNKAFEARIIVKHLESPKKETGGILGIESGDTIKVEVLDWGTDREGNSFCSMKNELKPGMIGYIEKTTMGLALGDKKFLINRGLLLGLD